MTSGTTDDERAYSEFVAANADQVRFTAYLLCRDWHEAEDLAQVAFVRLYLAWSRIDRSEPLQAYVKKIVVRTFLNNRRRLWRRLEQLVGAPPEPAPTTPPGPEERMAVWEALAQVAPRQRAALVLRYWEDLSVTETADVLGCSEGTVKSQCARGLQALRGLLTDPLASRGTR